LVSSMRITKNFLVFRLSVCIKPSTLCLILKRCRFVRRGFSECSIDSIPEQRRKRINLSRGSKYYIKQLQPKHASVTTNNFIIRWHNIHGTWCDSRRCLQLSTSILLLAQWHNFRQRKQLSSHSVFEWIIVFILTCVKGIQFHNRIVAKNKY
jgi:hypothetical protein